MGIKVRVSSLLEQEIDREEFLHHMGVALLQLMGLGVFFRTKRAAH
jgi:hypothetical protein